MSLKLSKDVIMSREECLDLLKYKQALEIIKNKKVNVMLFISLKDIGLKQYNKCFDAKEHQLTQEEWDLLKEVLER